MEENEKNINEKDINEEINRDSGLADANELEESKSLSADNDTSPTDTLPTELRADAELEEAKPVYKWNYEEQRAFESHGKKKKSSSAAVLAIVVSCLFLTAFALLVALLAVNYFALLPKSSAGNQNNNTVTSEKVIYVREYDDKSGLLTHQEIYDKCLPSVVSVSASNDTSSGIGSGFIISEDGYIVTANHVINGMTNINVILSNGDFYEASVVDGNEFTDIALLKINKSGLPAIKIGRSSELLVGDGVVAIGTPASIDFAGSFSEGAVSYNNRVLKIYNSDGSVQKKMTLIQTGALVNPGNSGCPLINEYGEVVGIVTMKLNSTYYEGMCFAIPTDGAMPIINAMREGKDYEDLLYAISRYPAKLGITVQNTTIEDIGVSGVEIMDFASAEYDISKKMKVGDVIVGIDSTTVSSFDQLSMILDKYSPQDSVRLTFYRSGQKMTVNVILGK